MRLNPPQLTFSAGEVSPLLYGRTDYQRTQSGLRQCRGFLPLRQGPVTRAPGTLYRGRTRGDAAARLVAFQFAEDDAVVLEFTHLRMRVWRYGALVMAGASPYELVTPYPAASLGRLKWVQSADVIYLVDGLRPPQRLARLALNSWTIGDASFSRGPFAEENTNEAVTISASGDIGAVTLSGVGGPFVAGHVGGLMSLRVVDDDTIPEWTGNTPVAVGDRMRYDGRVYLVTAGNYTGVNPPTHTRGKWKSGINDNATWLYRSDDTGIVRITAVTSANAASATVLKRLPPAVVGTPTYAWSEGAWSTKRGWPSSIALYDQRLVLAGTPAAPRTLWFSVIGDYADMEPGIEADDAFAYTIAGSQTLNRILWMQPGTRGLHVGALGEEYSSRASSSDQAIGAQNAAFRIDSTIGSRDVQPVAPDGRPVFLSRDGRRVFELRYAFEQDATSAVELSLPAEHLGADGFEEIAWQSAPVRLGWLRRGSGDLVMLIHDPQEEVLGWATLPVAGGVVESLCVSSSADGTDDVVTLVVRRTIGGSTVRHVEEVAPIYGVASTGEPIAAAKHLFAGIEVVNPAGFTTVSGLGHLEGQTVAAWTDFGELGPLVVSGGAVDLGAEVGRAFVGLVDATHVCETLDLAGQVREGGALGRPRRVKGVGLRWHRTAAAEMRQVERAFGTADVEGRWQDVTQLPVPADLVEGFSGVINVALPSGFRAEVTQQLRPVGGAPMTLAGLMPLAEISEG